MVSLNVAEWLMNGYHELRQKGFDARARTNILGKHSLGRAILGAYNGHDYRLP
jgi:hypothetical protein